MAPSPSISPATGACPTCAGPLETDGMETWCIYDCTGDSDTGDDGKVRD